MISVLDDSEQLPNIGLERSARTIAFAALEPSLVIERWRSLDPGVYFHMRARGSAVTVAQLESEANMKKMLTASAVAALALAMSVSAFAGGSHCSGGASATTANAGASCAGMKSAGWAGAWLQRSASGTVTVAEVAKGSPAAKAGLKSGDLVLAVNGYDLSDSEAREECASKASCKVGSTVTYAVQRGSSTRNIKLKLEKMPANATERYASREASFDPVLAAVVMPTAIN